MHQQIGDYSRTTGYHLWMAAVGSGSVHNAYFLLVGQAAPALHAFQGTVTIQPFTMVRSRRCAERWRTPAMRPQDQEGMRCFPNTLACHSLPGW